MGKPSLSDVFGIGTTIKRLSYVDRGGLDERLRYALDAQQHVIIHGDSKQGKSWLRASVLDADAIVQLQCHVETTAESLLIEVLGTLGIRADLRLTQKSTTKGVLNFKADSGLATAIIGRLGGGVRRERSSTNELESETIGQTPADLSWVGRVLAASERRWVIEDFHYVAESERSHFAFLLKALGEYGVYPVIVGVWPQDHLLTYYNGDLEGRIEDIHLTWSPEDLNKVLVKGSDALNISMSRTLRQHLIEDAHGNVGLLQRLAEQLCKEEEIRSREKQTVFLTPGDPLDRTRRAVAEAMRARFQAFADNFVQGMRRSQREEGSPYLHILRGVNEVSDSDLLAGVEFHALIEQVASKIKGRELRQALERIDRFQASLGISPIVLTYSTRTQRLALVDRSFLFFRRYGDPRWPWEDDLFEE